MHTVSNDRWLVNDVTLQIVADRAAYMWGHNLGTHSVEQIQKGFLPLLPGWTHCQHHIVQSC